MSRLGHIEILGHRDFPAESVKQVNIKYHGDKWYISMTVTDDVPADDEQMEKIKNPAPMVGIDVGLTTFAVMSDGSVVETPAFFRKSEKKLAKLQIRLSRKKSGSNNRKKAKSKAAFDK